MDESTATAPSPRFDRAVGAVTSKQQILYQVRAGQPLIYVVSSEEKRVERILREIADDRRRSIYFWSHTKGFEATVAGPDGKPLQRSNPDCTDPIDALKFLVKEPVSAIFVIRDFHEFIGQAAVKRHLRDVARDIVDDKKHNKTCILLSPIQKIPPELEKEFAVVDFDLPTIDDVKQIVVRVAKQFTPGDKYPDAAAWRRDFLADEAQQLKVAEAGLGLTEIEIESVLSRSLIMVRHFDLAVVHSEKEQIIKKSGTLEFLRPEYALRDVGGLELLKAWLAKRQQAFTREARAFGLPEPRGILMLGIPGCGKSLMAKSVSALWELPLVRLDVGKVFGSLVGASEEGMRRAIKTAESVAPCVLWLDELEKGLAGSQSSGQTDGGTTARVFGTFITWLQEKTSPVFVIGTANNIKMLPSELLRKGRFDEIFFVDLPSREERKQIIEIHLKRRGRDPSKLAVEQLADQSEGFSGSEIEQVVISALYDAFEENPKASIDWIEDRFLEQSISETVPLSRTMQEEITTMRDWAKNRARLASTPVQLEESASGRKLEI